MKIKEFYKNQKGLTAVEASIVVPIVIMIIMVMMFLGFIMYQKTALTVIANEAASSIGQVYSTNSKDPFIGFTQPDMLSDTYYYRSFQNALSGFVNIHGALDSEAEKKANWYARYRIVSTDLYKPIGNIDIETTFENTPGLVLQKTAIVTVKATYDLPFLRFFGLIDSTIVVSAVGRAQCFDILDYGSTMSLASTMMKEIVDPFSAKVSEAFEAIKTFVGYLTKSVSGG